MQCELTPSKSSQSPSLDTSQHQLPSQTHTRSFQYYNYPRAQNRKDPQKERHYLMTCVVIQFLTLSIVLFLSALAVDYLVVSTSEFGQIRNCLWSQIDFREWYSFICLQCQVGYNLTATYSSCNPI